MKLLSCLVFLIIIPSINGVLCQGTTGVIEHVMETSLIIPLKTFILDNLEEKEEELCRIQIYMLLPKKIIHIAFTNSIEHNELTVGDILLSTAIAKSNSTYRQTTKLDYSCSTHDYCELDFLFDYIYWLINEAYQTNFIEHSSSLLSGTNIDLEVCYDSNSDEGFNDGCSFDNLCTIFWEFNQLFQGCQNYLGLGIYILTQMSLYTSEQDRMIAFVCNYDQCNSNETFQNLTSIIRLYYDITPIRHILQDNQTFTTTQTHFIYSKYTDTLATTEISSTPSKSSTTTKTSSTLSKSSTTTTSSITTIEPTNSSVIDQFYFITIIIHFFLIF